MMKARFFLALLALNGLLLGGNSASANSGSIVENRHDITQLSRTISELVKLDPDSHSLVEMAINRALIAQKAGEPSPQPAGGIPLPKFTKDPQPEPIINGKIANPNPPATKPKPRVKRIVKPPQRHLDRQVKVNASKALPAQPLRPERLNSDRSIDNSKTEAKTNPSIQPSSAQIDRPTFKKLSECKDLTPENTSAIPVDNSTNANQPKVTIQAPIITPAPQVRHFIGARG